MGRTGKVLMAVLAAAAVVFTTVCVSSCEKYYLPSITLSQDTIFVNKAAQELSLVVNANVIWSFDLDKPKARWLSVTPEMGEGTATVKISIDENKTEEVRRATIPVTTSTLERSLYIVQSADDVLPEY